MQNAYLFDFKESDGSNLPLSSFEGKVLLVVNVASKCGFTPQYKELQALYDKYQGQGFEILAVPCNDFGGQEPATCDVVQKFARDNFKVTFKITDKYNVIGDNAHDFFKWAGQKVGILGSPKWNFHKYLISVNGEIIDWFSSATAPLSDKVVSAIEDNLPLYIRME